MTVKGLTSMLANILASRRYYPFMVQLIMGGTDRYGPKLYSLDALAARSRRERSSPRDPVLPLPMAFWRRCIAWPEHSGWRGARRQAIHNAMKRDSASGDKIELVRSPINMRR